MIIDQKDQPLQAFMPDCDWSFTFAPLEAVHLSFSSIPK
jgi:hypothetical protein